MASDTEWQQLAVEKFLLVVVLEVARFYQLSCLKPALKPWRTNTCFSSAFLQESENPQNKKIH